VGEYLPINELQANIDNAKSRDLVGYLNEKNPQFSGRGSGDVSLIRGYAMAALAKLNAGNNIKPYIFEELETGRNPYVVAAAAKASKSIKDEDDKLFELLAKSVTRVIGSNVKVWYDTISQAPRPEIHTTALDELVSALQHFYRPRKFEQLNQFKSLWAPYLPLRLVEKIEKLLIQETENQEKPSCCGPYPSQSTEPDISNLPVINSAVWESKFEDQAGQFASLQRQMTGDVSVISFFYTRCMNPDKCSLTVTNLAHLGRILADAELAQKVSVLGISFDPKWDIPKRLIVYGKDRGMEFSPQIKLLRSLENWEMIVSSFDLSVGYGPATVNQHSLDLFVIDNKTLKIIGRWNRQTWQPPEILDFIQNRI